MMSQKCVFPLLSSFFNPRPHLKILDDLVILEQILSFKIAKIIIAYYTQFIPALAGHLLEMWKIWPEKSILTENSKYNLQIQWQSCKRLKHLKKTKAGANVIKFGGPKWLQDPGTVARSFIDPETAEKTGPPCLAWLQSSSIIMYKNIFRC